MTKERGAPLQESAKGQMRGEQAATFGRVHRKGQNPTNDSKISYDYQLTYLYGARRDIMGAISGNKVKVSMPSIIDSFAKNLVTDVVVTLDVILLHELSHWADRKDYGTDIRHSPRWNSMLLQVIAEGMQN